MKPTVAWIGLGTMGEPMARHVLNAGFPLRVYNRTAARGKALEGAGAKIADTPRAAAEAADVTIVMVATPAAFEEVLAGPDGALAGLTSGSVLVDMGTDGPEAARSAARRAAERGATFVDAPVLGSRTPAEQAKLIVMAGGDDADIQRVRPVLEPTARSFHHVGPVGAGQQMKLATNLMLSHMLSGLVGAMSFARAVHLKHSDLIDILEAGLASPYFRVKGGQMASGNFHPQFTVDLVRKDLRLIQDALGEAGVPLPTVAPIREMFEEAARRGWGGEDGAAVVKLFGEAKGTTEGPFPSSTLR